MRFRPNKSGPRKRDVERFCRSTNYEDATLLVTTLQHRAQTGTVYVSVEKSTWDGKTCTGDKSRVYRFSSHSELYSYHDYSVWSGGEVSHKSEIPPGFDGRTCDAVADVKAWLKLS